MLPRPKLLAVFREGYTRTRFQSDVLSGLIVGIVALPLAIAFAIASGVRPEQGLYTAIIAGGLIALLSGSRVQIGGPTGAFVVLVLSVVQKHGYDGLAVATILAGLMLVAMGVSGLGALIQYIPYPVTVGFTSGIALIIATGQVSEFLGLPASAGGADFLSRWKAYGGSLGNANPSALVISLGTVFTLALWPRIPAWAGVARRLPASLIAIIVSTAAVHLLGLSVDTVGTRFGSVPTGAPAFRIPSFSIDQLSVLMPHAVAIALLAGIESLLSAVVADGMTGEKHDPDTELFAQGVANIVVPFFGGIAATGAIARTATNIKSGGTSPISGLVHAFTLLGIMLFFARWASLIPMATLAGILVVVAYNMSEWRMFARLLRSPRSDVMVLLAVFGLTVLVDLTVAIQVGVVLAALLFMRRMAQVSEAGFITTELDARVRPRGPGESGGLVVPKGVEVFEINGPFFFGAAEKFRHALSEVAGAPSVLILRMRRVPAMDATGMCALEDVFEKARQEGTTLVLSGVNDQPRQVLANSGLLDRIGEANVVSRIDEALARAGELVENRNTTRQAD